MLRKLKRSVRRLGPPADYHAEVGRSMPNYRDQLASLYRPRANPFFYYERLLDALAGMRDLLVLPLHEVAQHARAAARVVGLRHDVDADPETALRAARALAKRGMAGSFFLLHTAPYYGDFHGGVFIRNPLLLDWIPRFIVAGCELGVHNDALGVYQHHGKDGIAALRTEIEWLRANGALIRGTVAHNSAPVYGAENYEIFRNRVLWDRPVEAVGGQALPLGTVRESNLDLAYEGTFARPRGDLEPSEAAAFCADADAADILNRSWMERYLLDNPCCRWEMDVQFWLLGRDAWVAAGRVEGRRLFEWQIPLDRVLHLLDELPAGTRSVMMIHPVYVRGAGGGAER